MHAHIHSSVKSNLFHVKRAKKLSHLCGCLSHTSTLLTKSIFKPPCPNQKKKGGGERKEEKKSCTREKKKLLKDLSGFCNILAAGKKILKMHNIFLPS